MQPKHHAILYTFLGLALAVAIFLTLESTRKAEAASRALEDGYTQRVLECQEHLQAIGVKLNKAAVAGDAPTLVRLLTEASRQADGVAAGLSALPLSHAAMSDTIKFCNQLSEYLMTLTVSVAGGESLTDSQKAKLRELESQCSLLLGQFATARDSMLSESLRLATLENIYYQEAQGAARPLEQVADSDNGMDYPSMIYDGAFSDARHFGTPKALGNAYIDANQAVTIARKYVGEARVKDAARSAETAGTLASYGVTLTLNDGTVLNAEVTKQGGKLLWMVPEHAAFTPALTLEECESKAGAFLAGNGYGAMEANHYQVYDGLAVINFVSVQDGVLLYPDLVKVQVRMDTGEVVGMEANNYLMNHVTRTALSPALTNAQALAKTAGQLEGAKARLCVIPYRDMEKLCYEVAGSSQGQVYRVYVDAVTGAEVEILVMVDAVDGEMSAKGPRYPLASPRSEIASPAKVSAAPARAAGRMGSFSSSRAATMVTAGDR